MPELSIIIINYKTKSDTINCIKSIYSDTRDIKFEIIVVDNCSNDNSLKEIKTVFPDIIDVQMKYNSGFSRANNVGTKQSTGDYILFLNSDTIMTNNNLRKSLNHYKKMESSTKIGLMGCMLLNEDNTLQASSFNSFPGVFDELKKNPIYIKFFDKNGFKIKNKKKEIIKNHYKSHKPKWLCGAYLLTNNNNLKNDNLYFDESYFLYSEDVNLCYNFIKKGYSNYYYRDSKIKHLSGKSSSSKENKQLQIILSNWMFQLKTKGKLFFLIFISIVKLNYKLDKYLNKKTKSKEIIHALKLQKKALSLLPLLKERKDFLKVN
jgi:N-acetylglucosaminyl-diphospho-decaprenol L-rhamnosyltransferase